MVAPPPPPPPPQTDAEVKGLARRRSSTASRVGAQASSEEEDHENHPNNSSSSSTMQADASRVERERRKDPRASRKASTRTTRVTGHAVPAEDRAELDRLEAELNKVRRASSNNNTTNNPESNPALGGNNTSTIKEDLLSMPTTNKDSLVDGGDKPRTHQDLTVFEASLATLRVHSLDTQDLDFVSPQPLSDALAHPYSSLVTTTTGMNYKVDQPHDVEQQATSSPYPNPQGLAVALPVREDDEESLDPNMPAAVEFDPDAKPPNQFLPTSRRTLAKTCLCFFLLTLALVGGLVGVIVALQGGNDTVAPPEVVDPRDPNALENLNRTQSGIGAYIQEQVGVELFSLQDDNDDNAYKKALDWILYDDPQQLTLAHRTLLQRFVLAYFYFATSPDESPWRDCAAMSQANVSSFRADEDADFCHLRQGLTGTFEARWLSKQPECEWAGIECYSDETVATMQLDSIGLAGPIPQGLQHLPFLSILDMERSQLTGSLPASLFASLKYLNAFYANHNRLSGNLTDSLWTALSRNMGFLILEDNAFSGTISTTMIQVLELKTLSLAENKLEGSLPTQFGNLASLATIDFHDNALTGTLPTSLGQIRYALDVEFGTNRFTGTIPTEIGMAQELQHLNTQGNPGLSGSLPDELYDLVSLKALDLSSCNFTGTLSPRIAELPILQYLLLEDNALTGSIPTELGDIDGIVQVYLHINDFTGSVPNELCAALPVNQIGMGKEESALGVAADCRPDGRTGRVEVECACCVSCCDPDGRVCLVA